MEKSERKELMLINHLDNMRYKLCSLNSQIELHKEISYKLKFDFFIKRDDKIGIYGGNKVRKIEFIFKDILRNKKKKVFIFGPAGSHHVIANLIYGKDLFNFYSFLFPTYLYEWGDKYVRENTEIIFRFSKRYRIVRNPVLAFIIAKTLSFLEQGYFIPMGSTSPLSILGFVISSYEIKRDIDSGKVPEFDYVILPAGTTGTIAGLSLGFSIFGINSKIIGVRVVEKYLCNKLVALKLIKDSCNLISDFIDVQAIIEKSRKNFIILDGFLGRGYGFPTDDGLDAMNFFGKYMKVEKTYTAKTLSALLKMREIFKGKKVLFYSTLNSNELNLL
jgi:D-cysteine desulfhydrase